MQGQTCLLSDVITSGKRELLFRSHNAIYLRRGQQERFGAFRPSVTFKSQPLWSVREGKGVTRFRTWYPVATGNYLDRAKKIPKFAQTNGTFQFFDLCSGISGPNSRRASACPNLHECWTQPANVRCSIAQLFI